MNKSLLLLLILLLVPFVSAYETLTPYVNDFAGLMNTSEIQDLNNYATEIDNKTGYEIAIVTLNTTNGEDPFTYAQKLGDQNKVGKKGLDNGIVILWVKDTGKGAVATGAGAKAVISDSVILGFAKTNKHFFLEGNSYLAFGNIMKGVFEYVTPKPVTQQPVQTPPVDPGFDAPSAVIIDPYGNITGMLPVFMFVMVAAVVLGVIISAFGLGGGVLSKYDDSSSSSTSSSSSSKGLNNYRKSDVDNTKVPKNLPKRFMKRYKIVKKGDTYYKKKRDGSYSRCTDHTLVYLWLAYLTFRNTGGYAAPSAINTSTRSSSSSSSSSYSGFSSGGFSSSASSSGSFGGGGGFSGGGGGGGF
jgi:uncharacterized membrane protein YgcG